MAIVTMKRLSLLALDADKDAIFDALVKCGVVHIQSNGTNVDDASSENLEKLLVRQKRVEEAIGYVSESVASYNLANKRNKDAEKATLPKNSFARPKTEVDREFFLNFGQNSARLEEEMDSLADIREQLAGIKAQIAANRTEYATYTLYRDLPHPTTWFVDTESSFVQLSQLPTNEWKNVTTLADSYDMVNVERLCGDAATTVVVAVVHKSQADFFEKAMAYGLVKCGLHCDEVPMLIMERLDAVHNQLVTTQKQLEKQIAFLGQHVPEWQIYVDYLNLCIKKVVAYDGMEKTVSTFVLTGYYPAENEDQVSQALQFVSDSAVISFEDVGEEEFAPTLCKNNSLVKPFEFVTNMYSAPDYHEVDPNPVMSVFYFIVFGFMVADIGYGLVLLLAGIAAHFLIKQQSGVKTLLQMFGICGVSAIAIGALFGSCFAYPIYPGVIPDPSKYPMVMMILSLILGMTHIMAGLACKMAVKIKHGDVLAAWLSDFPWLFVFLGLIVAIWNMALDMAAYPPYDGLRAPKLVTDIGLYVCLGSLAIALIFAGIGTKGIGGKVIKSFGSAYGIISYFSDVMSYIRVFGLMLSSALIGSVVNTLGDMVLGDGGLGYVFAALVLVFAHMFNLVMGLLSVYIHNGRLAYVEFFNKFYTGEGTLFVPFGSDTKYTLLTDTPSNQQ